MSFIIRTDAMRRFRSLKFAALLAAITLVPGIACRAATPQVLVPAANVGAAVIGGVLYKSGAPLETKSVPLFNPANPPKGPQAVTTYRISYSGAKGTPVPGIFMAPVSASAATPVPCVLLLHGLGGSKADVLLLGIALARRGYASFAIDIAGHGERPRIGGKPVNKLTTGEMHDLVAVTAVDLRRAVDFIETRPEADKKRIGFLGISLGGIIGGLFAGNEPRLQAVALWAAGADWGRLFATSQHPFAIEFRKTNGVTSAEALQKTFADVDPLSAITKLAPHPLLLINGINDMIVPRSCADLLFNAAQQPKQRVLLPGGHIPDVTLMGNQSLTFFDQNLKK
jgi:cephalosporin-C deacetylase-like acetyl esterase